MRIPCAAAFALAILAPLPAAAVMGGQVSRDPNGVRQSVVAIESSAGELCSGAVIAPDLILTAAHCVLQRAAYRVVVMDRRFKGRSVRALAAAMHPDFVPGTTPREQPGVDLAIVKLAQPLGPEFLPLDPRAATAVASGERVDLAGFGVVAENRKGSARVLRSARLVSLGTMQVANRVLVVADETRLAETTGMGACRGDSGGPILRGNRLVGIVSWSSGALKSRHTTACGGLTAVTPVAEHGAWIAARSADLRRLNTEVAIARPSAGGNAADWVGR